MAITRRLVAQDDNDDNQWLKIDHDSRYIVNDADDWQFIFGPASELSNSTQIIKITARFDDATFNNLKVIAYLYDTQNNSIGNAASCTFKFYSVNTPDWTESLINTSSGTQLANNYFYLNPLLSTFSPLNFQGGDTLMIEATIVRLGVTYRDRVYINHLGIYDNVTRLRQDVDFLSITKRDM
jgi:hypothetical protein